MTVQLHQWAVDFSVEIRARYFPGKRNVVADKLLSRTDSGNKVAASGGGRQAVSFVGKTSDRSLLDKVHHKTVSVLLSTTGHGHSGGGHPTTSVGQFGCVCFPSILSDPSGPEQSDEVPESQNDVGSSSVAAGRMVDRPAASAVRGSERSTSLAQTTSSTSCGEVSSVGTVPISSQVEAIKYLLQERGIS